MTEFKDATDEDRKAYAEVARYLSRDAEAKKILSEIDKEKITVHIIHDRHNQYDPKTRTIDWDPQSALAVVDGDGKFVGVQSAAMALIHEGAHATDRHLTKHLETNNAAYQNDAEAHAVGVEDRVAKTLGEPQRFNHFGTPLGEADSTEHTRTRQDGSVHWVDAEGKVGGTYLPGTLPEKAPRMSWFSFESGSDSPVGKIGREMDAARDYVRALQQSRGGEAAAPPASDQGLAMRAAQQRGRD